MARSRLGACALALAALMLATPVLAQDKDQTKKSAQASGGGNALSVGIGNLTWGAQLTRIPGFLKLKSVEGVDYYVNLRSSVQFSGYKNPTLFFGAVDGKLYAVHIRVEKAAYDRLRADLTRAYGQGKTARDGESGGEVVSWKVGSVRLKLKSPAGDEIKLSAYYRPLASKLAVGQAYADPGASEELARLLPQGQAQPGGVAPAASADKEPGQAIDVGKFLGVVLTKKR